MAVNNKDVDNPIATEPFSRRLVMALLSTPLLFGCHVLALITFCYVSIHVVSHYVRFLYREDTLLPTVTQSVYSFHRFMTQFWFLPVGIFLVCDGAILFLLRLCSVRYRAVRAWLFSGVLMLILFGIFWILFAISIPIDFPEKSNWSPPDSARRSKDAISLYGRTCGSTGAVSPSQVPLPVTNSTQLAPGYPERSAAKLVKYLLAD